jgi:SAM-dependent methyltransferase
MIEFGVILAAIVAVGMSATVALLMFHAFFYVPFVPTEKRVLEKIVSIADLKDGEKVYDLGSGDGRVLEEALKMASIQATGIEVSRMVLLLGKIRRYFKKTKIQFLRKNFFKHDLSDADVVFCYLFPGVMKGLQEKFEKELKQGARVISYSFPMVEWQPKKTLITREDKPKNFLVYRYDVPESFRSKSKA